MTERLIPVARRLRRSERGAFTAMAVALILMLFVVAGLVVDGGFVLNARAQTYDDVEQAARQGANQIDENVLRSEGRVVLITASAVAEAEAYMWSLPRDSSVDRGGYSTVAARADDTSVTVRAEREVPTTLLRLIGIQTLHVAAEATADAQVGIDAPIIP